MFWQRWFTSITKTETEQKDAAARATEVCVVVKPGVKEVETGIEMGGWQGRVIEVDEDNDLITVAWDSITLVLRKNSRVSKQVIAH